jgi:hypothetical protein
VHEERSGLATREAREGREEKEGGGGREGGRGRAEASWGAVAEEDSGGGLCVLSFSLLKSEGGVPVPPVIA